MSAAASSAEQAPGLESGRGIQVVTPTPEHRFSLDDAALRSLLLREDIKDRAVVVISVAGAFRKGKSFLLGFLLRYLHHKYNLDENGGQWLGAEDEPLKGFSWRGGCDRHTMGLLLWSQPFKTTLDNGDEVVIFLMDTQGAFDSQSTVRDNATIFAFSTMIASVQIYNLSQNIQEHDLQHLQLFTDYGRLAQQSSSGRPFQRLQFLVRDWSFPYDHPYGDVGGQQLLAKRLEVHESQHDTLRTLREAIKESFEDLACFLMPYPGEVVATNPDFNGKLADISQNFKDSLKQLVPMLLARENLVPKLIGGQKVKAKDLFHYFKAYMEIFNGSELPELRSILEATAEANNLSAMADALEVFDTLMAEVCGGTKPYVHRDTLETKYREAMVRTLHSFDNKRKMGGEELAERYKQQLVEHLEIKYIQLCAYNVHRKPFVYRQVDWMANWMPPYYHLVTVAVALFAVVIFMFLSIFGSPTALIAGLLGTVIYLGNKISTIFTALTNR